MFRQYPQRPEPGPYSEPDDPRSHLSTEGEKPTAAVRRMLVGEAHAGQAEKMGSTAGCAPPLLTHACPQFLRRPWCSARPRKCPPRQAAWASSEAPWCCSVPDSRFSSRSWSSTDSVWSVGLLSSRPRFLSLASRRRRKQDDRQSSQSRRSPGGRTITMGWTCVVHWRRPPWAAGSGPQ